MRLRAIMADGAGITLVRSDRTGIVEDAERLGRWMLQRDPHAVTHEAEQNVALPTPVPIYITYLTAQTHDGQLSFVDDIYGRDGAATEVAALR